MKQKISIAADRLSPKDLSRNHYTTLNFGSPFPIFVEECVNKDKFNIRVSNFSRLAPMYLPNLGSLNLKIHAFYVPFRLVWNHFENFREGLPSWNSSGAYVYKNVPLVDDVQLSSMFINNPQGRFQDLADWLGPESSNINQSDFVIYENGQYNGYVFTPRGKAVYHMLIALGYNFKFLIEDGVSAGKAVNTQYSALPLLCWFKTFLDYFIPSQLQPSSRINQLFNTIHDYNSSQIATPIGYDLLRSCIDEICLYYQNNYFTSAWMQPNAPVTGLNNIGSTNSDMPIINNVSSQGRGSDDNKSFDQFGQGVSNSSDGVMSHSVRDSQILSADGLTFLQKFARFIKRSNFAGSRAVERILARFGVRVEDFQVGMCRYLGSETLVLQKSDVTVTGNTQEAGEFVGKGFFSGGSNRVFKCDCDLSGMIIVSASLETPSTYLDGVRRRNLHITPLDFYTPELDGGTMQAISGCEVHHRAQFINDQFSNDFSSLGLNYDDVFGFTPRYSEYKFALDDISGDFSILAHSQNIDAFILPRRIFDDTELLLAYHGGTFEDVELRQSAYDVTLRGNQNTKRITPVQSLFSNDSNQFNRIFKDTSGLEDPVFSVFHIQCVVNSVTQPLNESAELQGRGKMLDFETNGVHLS